MSVVDNTGSYDEAELLGRVGGAMDALRERGIRAGASVLLIAPNRRAAVAVYLAALRVGARVVAVDRRAGAADLRHAVTVTAPALVVADPSPLVGSLGLPVLSLDDAAAVLGAGGDAPVPDLEADCVVVFTSGTSSRPKAVRHSMRSLQAGVRNFAHILSFTSADAAFLVSPFASITGVLQLHLALEYGGRLILEDEFAPASSLQRLIDLSATVFGGAPFVLEELLAEATRRKLPTLPLRSVAVGGSAIPRPLLEEAAARYGIVPSRVYGSSECPNAFGSAPDDSLQQRLDDEGVAMTGTEGRVDPATGELLVRGENLFGGYLDPQDNAEAFTADGWYRTGDQATLTGGRLRITGRLKEVVARKGVKISLAEIDEAMRGMPGCLAAAAYGLPDDATGERVALAVQADAGYEFTLDGVTGWLQSVGLTKSKLPEQVVVWHEPLPRTASGKVIRRELADGSSGRQTLYAARLSGRS